MSIVVTTDFLNVFTEVERSERFDLVRFLLDATATRKSIKRAHEGFKVTRGVFRLI